MRILRQNLRRLAVMLYLSVFSFVFTLAQNTTSTISGTTSDADEVLPGAIVRLTETGTGTTYTTVSNQKGQFRFDGLRPGGPYRLEVSFVGHNKAVVNIKRISLGELYSCDVKLSAGNELREVIITSQAAARVRTRP